MQITVKDVKERLRLEFEQLLAENLPADNTVIEYEHAENDRVLDSSLLQDFVSIVFQLHDYKTTDEVADIMGQRGGLAMLLSQWKYRIKTIVQHHIK